MVSSTRPPDQAHILFLLYLSLLSLSLSSFSNNISIFSCLFLSPFLVPFHFFLSLSHFSTFSYPLFSFYPFVFSFLYFSPFFSFLFPSCFFLSFPILFTFSPFSFSVSSHLGYLFFYFTSFPLFSTLVSSIFLFLLILSSFSSQLCSFFSFPFSFPFFRPFQFLFRFLRSFFSSLSRLILFPYLRDTTTVQFYNLFYSLGMISERRSFTILYCK
jgi:hypothetical protein